MVKAEFLSRFCPGCLKNNRCLIWSHSGPLLLSLSFIPPSDPSYAYHLKQYNFSNFVFIKSVKYSFLFVQSFYIRRHILPFMTKQTNLIQKKTSKRAKWKCFHCIGLSSGQLWIVSSFQCIYVPEYRRGT